MNHGTMETQPVLVPGPNGMLRLSPLLATPSGPRRPNRKRHTWLWRIVILLAGIAFGWLLHGVIHP